MTSCTPGYAGGYLLCASTCTGAEKGLLLQLQRPPVGGDDGVHGGGAQAALLQRPYTGDGGAAGGAYLILHQAEGLAALVTSDKNKPTTYGITDGRLFFYSSAVSLEYRGSSQLEDSS